MQRAQSSPPVREVSAYSTAERAALKRRFAARKVEYLRSGEKLAPVIYATVGAIFLIPLAMGAAYLFLGKLAGWVFPWVLIPLGLCIAVIVLMALRAPKLSCPGCGSAFFLGFGPYCPECGARALEDTGSKFFGTVSARCMACQKSMSTGGRTTSYLVRNCTNCGLNLDDEGLAG